MEYKTYRVKELVSKLIDNRGKNTNYYSQEKYPIIDNYMIKNELYPDLHTATRYLSEEQYNSFLRGHLKTDYLLMTLVGNGIGNITLAPHSTCAIVQNTIGISFNNEICDCYYAFYYFKTIQYAIRNLDRGSSQPSVNRADVLRLKVLLPNITAQKKISESLIKYDKLIELNNKRIKVLEQMAEELYKEWFVRFRFPGHESVEFENGIPKGWDEQRLSEFGIVLDSGSRPTGGIDDNLTNGIPSLGAEVINGLAEFDYSSVKLIPSDFYNNMKRGKNKGNHILLYKDGAYIGKTTIFRNEFPYKYYAVNEHVFLMNAVNPNYQNYLYFTLHQFEYYTLMQNLNRNAAQPGLSKPDISRIKINVPEKSIINSFNSLIEPVFDEVFKIAKQNYNLIKQRDLLLPRLMSGKLEV